MIRRKSAVTFLGCVAFIGVSISALVSGAAIAAQAWAPQSEHLPPG